MATNEKITVAVSGAAGSVGGAVTAAILKSPDFELVGASSRRFPGQDIGEVLKLPKAGIKVVSSAAEALAAGPQVFIDYTHSSVVFQNCAAALNKGISTVVGASGLPKEKLQELGRIAEESKVGVFSAGNFSMTAAMLQHLAKIAAKHLPSWEIIDYGKPVYTHVPSSTGRELADTLASVRSPELVVPPEAAVGMKEARGASVAGTQIHSIRSQGYGFSLEAIFGLKNERLVLRHDASESPDVYVAGTLLAAKAVLTFTGLKRGIDSLLFDVVQ